MKKLSFFLMAMLVSLTSFAVDLGEGYEKVTNISSLATGDKVVLYCDDASVGVTGWGGGSDATVAASGFVEYLVTVVSGGVTLKDEGAGQYIAKPTGNHFKYNATAGTCSVNASGVIACNARYLYQNGTYYRMYADKSGNDAYKPFYVYKVVADAGGAETEDLGDALKWSAATATVQMGADDNEYPTLTNDKNVAVTYSSSSTEVATIDANGKVTLVKEGTTTISAFYEGGEIEGVTYAAKTVSYTLTVKPAPLVIEPIEGGIIDVLTHKTLAATSSSYAEFTGKQAANENHSDAVYAGRSSRNGNATQYSIQLNTIDKGRIATTTSGGIAKRVYVKWSTQGTLNTNDRALNIYGSNDAFKGSENTAPSTRIGTITFTTGAAEAYVDLEGDYKHILITANGAIYMDEIQVTWVVAEGTVTTPTISGADEFIESTEVTISAEDGLKVYYTLDGTDPTNASTEYTAPFELTATTTVKAVAYDGEKASGIVSKTFKKLQVLTCEEAAALCTSTESADKYVIRGYVTNIATAWSDQYSNISFWMADTKNGGKVFEAFRVQPVIAAEKAVKVGDYVEVIGNLVLYGTTPETAAGGTYTIIPAPVTPATVTVVDPIGSMSTYTGVEYDESAETWSKVYNVGDEVTIGVDQLGDGWVFAYWTVGEEKIFTEEYTFTVAEDVTITATYAMAMEVAFDNLVLDAESGLVEAGPDAVYGIELTLGIDTENNHPKGYGLVAGSSISLAGDELELVTGYFTEVDQDTPSAEAVVIALYEDMLMAFVCSMSAAAEIEATIIEIADATVTIEERSMGFGDEVYHVLKMESTWSDGETTYPVLLETTEFDQTKESQEVAASITVGGWGDEDPWLGSAEGNVTITVADGKVTVKGLLENAYAMPAPIAFDVTISGTLPVEEPDGPTTALDNLNTTVAPVKMIENGQLIIINNGVKYNALGQEIK